ncbi:G-protein coupled receptor family C group 5 member C-like protein [Lates japonicus]|uniref:G-protein coupled receptor family C group 5 member C-like protein n=1 Tax=Lates japonicus TaxID=270547 RepID=A0AAD3QX38_LATJO|nr:G-protein coupled receptor family C group 5 member C-like protein [Lates japonicus]
MDLTSAPKGCASSISSIYYNLCDLTTVWGVVVEAVAAAGVVTSFVLFIILMASLPFVTDKKRKGMVALQAGILVCTLGLFGLSFAFIVGQYSTSCAARRFLFGVLFSGCLACLAMHGLWLALLERRGRGPRSWMLCLGALGLWLVEVIINTEWLIITVVRSPLSGVVVPDLSCSIDKKDFVMSLIYVMVLLVAVWC